MKEFLDYLKEECLPGIWSKGIALSRAAKSIERLNHTASEMKYKIQTTERMLAFQVTLWPNDQDAHCNCGSKIEPCHHIVAVALAESQGLIDLAIQSVIKAEANPDTEAQIALRYEWQYSASLKLGRFFGKTPVEGTLSSYLGGIQSGRIKAPKPNLSQLDLRLDEFFVSQEPAAFLDSLSDLGPLPLNGHPDIKTVKVHAKPIQPELLVRDSGKDGIKIESRLPPMPHSRRISPEWIEQNGLLFYLPKTPAITLTLNQESAKEWVTEELPDLLGQFELKNEGENLPIAVKGVPRLVIQSDSLNGALVLTATIQYVPEIETKAKFYAIERDQSKEQELIKKAAAAYGLRVGVPKTMDLESAMQLHLDNLDAELKTKIENSILKGLEQAFQLNIPKLNGNELEKNKDSLLRLLEQKQQVRSPSRILSTLASRIVGVKPTPGDDLGPIPNHLLATLRDYQQTGVHWLKSTLAEFRGALLADDMGLGKTLQTLATLNLNKNSKHLIIAPTSLLHNWRDEANRFRPDLKVCVYHGPGRKLDEHANLILTTYSLMRLDSEILTRLHFETVVLDEAHLIRNAETGTAEAARTLSADFRIALTGTPIQNRPADLESLFLFLFPGETLHSILTDETLLKSLILRRTKAEVLTELPPKTYLVHEVELSEDEQSLYEAVFEAGKADATKKLAEAQELKPFTFFELLLRARQVCNHRALVDPKFANAPSSKLKAILELTRELTDAGHSVLVYSQWTSFLDLLERALAPLPYYRLDGSTVDRGSVVGHFQASNTPTVFLLSLQAGGVGLNLTKATHVIFCDPWWNPSVEQQAEDRAYRMGQEKPVTIHRMRVRDTIEMDIADLQNEKKSYMDWLHLQQ